MLIVKTRTFLDSNEFETWQEANASCMIKTVIPIISGVESAGTQMMTLEPTIFVTYVTVKTTKLEDALSLNSIDLVKAVVKDYLSMRDV